jgi:hypothetical protein
MINTYQMNEAEFIKYKSSGELPFVPLKEIQTNTATSFDETLANVKINAKRNLPRLHGLPEFHKVKGHDKLIAIVGGGPSLKDNLDELRKFKTIIACGSVNDFLMGNGITPTYATICDPDPLSINYFQKRDTEVKYLLASGCDAKIFDYFKDYQVVMWHCHSDDYKPDDIEPGYQAIGGGCTVGLRSICISQVLGYTNVHMFGFDSCLGLDGNSHAYLAEDVGHIYDIKVGNKVGVDSDSKTYKCAGYQLAQAHQFLDYYKKYYTLFTPTIHGDGLLAAIVANETKSSATKEAA